MALSIPSAPERRNITSSDDSEGLTLLKKWQTMDAVIRAGFSTFAEPDCVFTAFGKIKSVDSLALHLTGKDFDLVCGLSGKEFENVCDEDLLRKINPALVGRQPETLTIVFAWGERCTLTRPSILPS
jgi:hypothetical protein